MARALAHRADGDQAAGCAALRRAVSMAEPERYVRVFADEGPALVPLLKGLPAGPDGGYVRRLVGACLRTRQPVAEASGPLLEPLSDRERDVLRLLATDLGGPQIAGQLHVSLNTLRTHSRNIFRKLDVTSRRAAVRRADELGLLRDAASLTTGADFTTTITTCGDDRSPSPFLPSLASPIPGATAAKEGAR